MKPVINFTISLLIVLLVISIGTLYFLNRSGEETPQEGMPPSVSSFKECVNAGYSIMESFPRQCETPDGNVFIEDITEDDEEGESALIEVFGIRPGQTVSSPLLVEGQARGYWYFEADFPIRLIGEDGDEIAYAIAQAQEDWMTEEFVPFSVILEFEVPESKSGRLVFERNNPSGLPENDDELVIPVNFARPTVRDGCIITGCSSHICSDREVITTCEFLPRYSCYKTASCERQQSGECGWTQTDELIQCLSAAQ